MKHQVTNYDLIDKPRFPAKRKKLCQWKCEKFTPGIDSNRHRYSDTSVDSANFRSVWTNDKMENGFEKKCWICQVREGAIKIAQVTWIVNVQIEHVQKWHVRHFIHLDCVKYVHPKCLFYAKISDMEDSSLKNGRSVKVSYAFQRVFRGTLNASTYGYFLKYPSYGNYS